MPPNLYDQLTAIRKEYAPVRLRKTPRLMLIVVFACAVGRGMNDAKEKGN